MGQTDLDGDIEMIDPVENQLQESLKNAQNKITGDLNEGFNNLQNQLTETKDELKDELKSLKFSSSEISRNVENDGFRNLENCITKQLGEGFKSLSECFKNQSEELHEQVTRLENELKNLSSTSSDEPRHTIGSNESKNVENKLKTGVDHQEAELDQLRKENKRLRDENANYQATMGIATSYRFADDDQNNSVNFNKDINDLNNSISKFVTNLKKDVKIHLDKVSELLQQYKCNKETQEGIQLAKEVLKRL
ncbi:21501_t:CDS:1, partial [Gigaspora rosea]